jgi:hypothetical protein
MIGYMSVLLFLSLVVVSLVAIRLMPDAVRAGPQGLRELRLMLLILLVIVLLATPVDRLGALRELVQVFK